MIIYTYNEVLPIWLSKCEGKLGDGYRYQNQGSYLKQLSYFNLPLSKEVPTFFIYILVLSPST